MEVQNRQFTVSALRSLKILTHFFHSTKKSDLKNEKLRKWKIEMS